jgi:tetratricopeptide (TPR) repeat protein
MKLNIPYSILKPKPLQKLKQVCGLFFFGFIIPIGICAQDQEDASLFLEEYSDEFQEAFFTALQQKGIQNYDRAVNALQTCLQLQPDQAVLYHELAKVYYLDKKYSQGFTHAVEAVQKEPENFWYVETFWKYQSRKGSGNVNRVASPLSATPDAFWANLAKLYLKLGILQQAEEAFSRLGDKDKHRQLGQEIAEMRTERKEKERLKEVTRQPKIEEAVVATEANPLDDLKKRMRSLQQEGEFDRLFEESGSASEAYPLQPDFYYYRGWALLKNGKTKEGLEILEESLAYLLEEGELSLFIYQALAEGYELLGDTEKLKYYQKKLLEINPQ